MYGERSQKEAHDVNTRGFGVEMILDNWLDDAFFIAISVHHVQDVTDVEQA